MKTTRQIGERCEEIFPLFLCSSLHTQGEDFSLDGNFSELEYLSYIPSIEIIALYLHFYLSLRNNETDKLLYE